MNPGTKQRKVVSAFVSAILLSPSYFTSTTFRYPIVSAAFISTPRTFSTTPKSSTTPVTCKPSSSFPHSMTSSTSTSSGSSGNPNPLTEYGLPTPLILGSGSFTRKLILKEMNIPYILKVRPIDERNIGDRSDGSDPKQLVMTLARAKGEHLIQGLMLHENNGNEIQPAAEEVEDKYNLNIESLNMKEFIVLTADQVVTCNNSILEKPNSISEAKEFVKRYGTSPPSTVGAVMLTHIPSGISVSGVDTAQINFSQKLSEDGDGNGNGGMAESLIDRLIEDGAPVMSCAGGLMVEHPFVKEFIEGIDGTEDSVMGLSKDLVLRLLQELKEKLSVKEVGEA